MARYGIVVDLDRCVGCMTCVISCKEENLTPPGVWWNQILQVEHEASQRITYVRYACMHCENPPCVKACPNQAVYQRADGIVLVDKDRCKGVGACVKACPYQVMILNPEAEYFTEEARPYAESAPAHRRHVPGQASMCTLCVHRVDEGGVPACVAGCPSRAMVFGDLDDPQSAISHATRRAGALRADAGTSPKVTYSFPEGLRDHIDEEVRKDPHQPR